jgi:hypothetical protein
MLNERRKKTRVHHSIDMKFQKMKEAYWWSPKDGVREENGHKRIEISYTMMWWERCNCVHFENNNFYI